MNRAKTQSKTWINWIIKVSGGNTVQDRKPGDADGTKNCGQAPSGAAALRLWGPCEHSWESLGASQLTKSWTDSEMG